MRSFEPTSTRARVDALRRRNIERNHSATHLVHAALRKYLGTHVRQQGSLVDENHLRFDFSHHGPIKPEMLQTIEREVNARIWDNVAVNHPTDGAIPRRSPLGAMALFSEKYGDQVASGVHGRVVHRAVRWNPRAQHRPDRPLPVPHPGGVAAGVRRIEAVTGPEAYAMVEALQSQTEHAAKALKAQPEHLRASWNSWSKSGTRLAARVAEMVRVAAGRGRRKDRLWTINGVTVTLAESAAENRDEIAAMADALSAAEETRAALILFGTGGARGRPRGADR